AQGKRGMLQQIQRGDGVCATITLRLKSSAMPGCSRISVGRLARDIWSILSQTRFSTGAIFRVTVPATIIRSDCRGEGRNTSAPNRAISKREVVEAIISIAQHARPNVSGHMADLRAQLNT